MNSNKDAILDQSRAIREQADHRPEKRQESAQQARLRTQIEQERKRTPMTGGVK